MGKKTGACRVVGGKPEGKKRLNRPERRWDAITRIYLNRYFGRAWNGLIFLRRNGNGLFLMKRIIKCGFHEMGVTLTFSWRTLVHGVI
jgi:hypothetical protein